MKVTSPPFCWQDKRALRIIREQSEDYGTALTTYVALCVVASDLQKEQFQTTHSWLAQMAGTSVSTIRRRLEDLRRIGLVTISTPKLKAPSTYTLLAIGHDGRTIVHQERTFALSNGPQRATSEVQQYSKASKTEIAPDWLSGLANESAYKGINLDTELSKARRWCSENNRQCTRRFFVNWLNRCRPQTAGAGAAAVQPTTADEILKAAL